MDINSDATWIRVNASTPYPIIIGKFDGGALSQAVHGRRTLIITSKGAAVHLQMVRACLPHADHVILPDGEAQKTLTSAMALYESMTAHGMGRDGVVVALGGGVVGDLTGFVAATYMRGIDFIQIPTTLLAQVDSSVGGKTGVNHGAKNNIGAFWQPILVLCAPAFLSTLNHAEYIAGLAEVVKVALIFDEKFLAYLERHVELILAKDERVLTYIIATACQIKADIVAKDERETGTRALLNFGHTFGHAIEVYFNYTLRHGEAVAMGMIHALRLSARIGLIDDEAVMRARDLISKLGLPTVPSDILPATLFSLMQKDKKNHGGQIRLVLLNALGSGVIYPDDGALLDYLECEYA